MATAALTTKQWAPNSAPWADEAMGAVTTAGKVLSVMHVVREAIPVVQGIARAGMTASSYMTPFVLRKQSVKSNVDNKDGSDPHDAWGPSWLHLLRWSG